MDADPLFETAEGLRLVATQRGEGWRRWGPYLSERQWGTVREDYSPGGTAWDYLPHDQARSRAYRWGEDGLAGFADDKLRWCLSLGLWNEQDAILKERLFGLTNEQGNHGEDVKELYYYVDGTPTHSYMKMLYKYPHAAFPYERLVAENKARGTDAREFEVIDTGVFHEQRYFDVEVEYAKASTDDILMLITVHNRGPDMAPLHILPQFWSRNTWTWVPGRPKPQMVLDGNTVRATHPALARVRVCEVDAPGAEWLFCENETNYNRIYGGALPGPFKDGINDYVVNGKRDAVNSLRRGTKCAARVRVEVPAGGQAQLRLRLRPADSTGDAFTWFDSVMDARREEADAFYAVVQRDIADADERAVHRQALAGMLWSKQFYALDVRRWLDGDPGQPAPPEERKTGRNADWRHLDNADVISMPDTWEYPWYAAWDLAFHTVTFALIDPAFAKAQLLLLMRERYMHPNGQLPAYEWAFGDVNPPVHGWAVLRVFQMDRALTGVADRKFLEMAFHKLLLNFTWWVNRKDESGRNLFQGGFLGLDNITIFDRSHPLPTGGMIDQSDGTAWMAMFTLNMMRIALELAIEDDAYEDMATKFFEHFLYIAEAMTKAGGIGLWDEQDQFFYDVLHLPDGQAIPLRVRSIVGLIPLFAVEVIGSRAFQALPAFSERLQYFLDHRPDLAALISRWTDTGTGERHLLSLLRGHRMKMLLRQMLDESEFLSQHGVRALSKYHEANPYVLEVGGAKFSIGYEPGEGVSHAFGGNSNWRGPIWMPVNILLVDSLREFHRYYGDDFQVECPVGSGQMLSLKDVATMLATRLKSLFVRGADGRRPFLGDDAVSQADPEFRDHILFHEYFHGDTGRGLGAAHQTGWTGCIALLLSGPNSVWAKTTAEMPSATPGRVQAT
ncbi:MGH1-like glycoside hydrolase domain-containing protein [Acidisphaera sp. L21]|uniref:MGH1-like glycoside hydrolase domain-containing protein n=1 Tax=Acidisphaera sp. L21 TaxID=1641851 RepID=UPI00131D3A4E|nr:glucosidase [Acidisphaera sp. L21]